MWTYGDVIGIVSTVLAIVLGLGGAPAVVQWIKGATGASGRAAVAVSVAVAVLFALLTMVVEGAISPETLTPANAGTLLMAVWTASQVQYHLIGRKTGAGN